MFSIYRLGCKLYKEYRLWFFGCKNIFLFFEGLVSLVWKAQNFYCDVKNCFYSSMETGERRLKTLKQWQMFMKENFLREISFSMEKHLKSMKEAFSNWRCRHKHSSVKISTQAVKMLKHSLERSRALSDNNMVFRVFVCF